MSSLPAMKQLDAELQSLYSIYCETRPASAERFRRAAAVLPGSNTRSVLHFQPFPLYIAHGHDAEVRDVDGHTYADFVGEFSAGLFGHSDPVVAEAIRKALDGGIVLAGPTDLEVELAYLLQARFPSMERIRFCNSGTEANILALMTAIAHTGRRRVLVFNGAYHGGVLTFPAGGNPLNIPLDFIAAEYNDLPGTEALIREHGAHLAAIIIEPILGAGGNIPATPEFIAMLRRAANDSGALLVFDEVKTSRCGAGGMQARFGASPDLTTLGKYIGGGLACGAFGGRSDIMMRFDPQARDSFKHAGTFNNNVCAMAAGIAGLGRVFTSQRADEFLASGEAFRAELNAECADRELPMQFTGLGSLATVHFTARDISSPADIPAHSRTLAQLFHMFCLLRGVLVASRGDIFMSLPTTREQRGQLRAAVADFIGEHGDLVRALDRELVS